MLYTDNLDQIVFHRHQIHPADELIVLSGYLGPSPVRKLGELPFNSRVIYGMYGSDGIKPTLHNSLLSIQREVNNLNIFYSILPVHSKCYLWRKRGEIIHALVGSANFSTNGLTTPYREVLAETTFDTFHPLNTYVNHVLQNSISCLEVDLEEIVDDGAEKAAEGRGFLDERVCSMTLLGNDGEVQPIAGLNWGQNPRNHTNPNDAYIPIRTSHIRNYPSLFPAKQINPMNEDNRGRPQRHNDTIEIVWDDGVVMEGLLEGSQPVDGIKHPKNLSSFPSKSNLGSYIRERLRVPSGQPVWRHHLERYGRTDISVSLLGEGVYYFDFSV